jgi:hypothetical protein
MEMFDSVVAYRVFRNIFMDEESYSVQLELKHGLDDEASEQVILEASEEGFLDAVKDSQPRQYQVDLDALADEWHRLWAEETGERPVTPENFDSFLKSYIRSYLRHEENSTLRDMLVEQFYLGLSQETANSYLTKDFRELRERLSKKFEGKRAPHEHIKYGLDHR